MHLLIKVTVALLASLSGLCEGKPVYARWSDYDYLPISKPIQDTPGSVQVVGTVNPLRPYEPWVLDCILFSSDKVEPGKRHERCQDVDDQNMKEYAKFLYHVAQWEQAYPERATRWNTRFPDGKEKEKQRYEQLKSFADMHKKNVPPETSEGSATTTAQQTQCPVQCSPDSNAKGDQGSSYETQEPGEE